jgi:hypothetical protein
LDATKRWNRAIVKVVIVPDRTFELDGIRSSQNQYACALCGAGFGFRNCHGCGVPVDDMYDNGGFNYFLPPVIIALLSKSGHSFKTDPALQSAKR